MESGGNKSVEERRRAEKREITVRGGEGGRDEDGTNKRENW